MRRTMFGRRCRLVAVGTMGTVLIQLDTGERVTTARRALRRVLSQGGLPRAADRRR